MMEKAEIYLKKVDKKFVPLIKEHGPCSLGKVSRTPFKTLITSIMGQQLSTKAAYTISQRVYTLLGTKINHWPDKLIKSSEQSLRDCGLSRPKAGYLQGLGQAVIDGELNFTALKKMDDEELIKTLVQFKGVGKWTAEMFLMFGLGRQDIFSLGDLGLRNGVKLLYKFEENPSDDELIKISNQWKPYRSVASWYLWRSLG